MNYSLIGLRSCRIFYSNGGQGKREPLRFIQSINLEFPLISLKAGMSFIIAVAKCDCGD